MAHPLANALVVARRAAEIAKRTNNREQLEKAAELAVKILMHPHADSFFEMLSDFPDEGVDPTIDDEEFTPIDMDPADERYKSDDDEELPDDDSDAASPADEGLVHHEASVEDVLEMLGAREQSALGRAMRNIRARY